MQWCSSSSVTYLGRPSFFCYSCPSLSLSLHTHITQHFFSQPIKLSNAFLSLSLLLLCYRLNVRGMNLDSACVSSDFLKQQKCYLLTKESRYAKNISLISLRIFFFKANPNTLQENLVDF